MKGIGRHIAVILIFGFIGFIQFSENVRTVQVVGLFASGAAFGVGLSGLINALRSKQKPQ